MTLTKWLVLVLTYLFIPSLLFICSGDLSWWQAWVVLFSFVLASSGARIWAERRHPGLLAERTNLDKEQGIKSWDKVLAPLMALSTTFPLFIVAGFDRRLDWSEGFSLELNVLGLILIVLGYSFAAWSMVENRFFSSMVRIQTDRQHVVCDSGPYRYVRHPAYAGNLLPLVGFILALDSLWLLIPVAIAVVITVIRTLLEDQTLQEELPGYSEYTQRVHYRLIPGVF